MIFFLNLNKNENFYNHKNDQILYFNFFSILLRGVMINITYYSIRIFSILKIYFLFFVFIFFSYCFYMR